MTRTRIEWATHVWNPVTGCTKVSEGCRNCYAERMARRFEAVHEPAPGQCWDNPPTFGDVICHPDRLDQPLHWRKPRRVFVCSMSDLFHKDVPDDFLDAVFAAMALSVATFMVLTKRPARMLEYVSSVHAGKRTIASTACHDVLGRGFIGGLACADWIARGCPNLWLGVSVENQATADERIPLLLQTPAAVRFVSGEPMLGAIDFRKVPEFNRVGGINPCQWWVICGGESGPGARPMHPDWARSLRDQCQAAGVPFFFKQWGEWAPHYPGDTWEPTDRTRHAFLYHAPGLPCKVWRIGKKAAGRELDGRTWDEIPEVRP